MRRPGLGPWESLEQTQQQKGWDTSGEPGWPAGGLLGQGPGKPGPLQPAAAPGLGQKKRALGSEPLPPSSLAQVPTSTSVSVEHGHVQVGGASVSLEAVVSVVSSRAVSNQDIVPGNAGAPP